MCSAFGFLLYSVRELEFFRGGGADVVVVAFALAAVAALLLQLSYEKAFFRRSGRMRKSVLTRGERTIKLSSGGLFIMGGEAGEKKGCG